MASSTIAEQRLAVLKVDRRTKTERLKERVRHVPRLARDLEHASRAFNHHDDPVAAAFTTLADPVFKAVSGECGRASVRDPRHLFIADIEDDHASATLTIFPDNSGLVIVSSALFSLLQVASELSSARRTFRRRSGRWRRLPAASGDAQTWACALRYFVLHERVFGLSAIVGIRRHRGPDRAVLVLVDALRFVLAHEAAHFCLGHAPPLASPAAEFDADALALRGLPRKGTLLGARLALVATELLENALFIRRPHTHPSAAERWERLCDEATTENERAASVATADLAAAAQAAQDMTFRLPLAWWDAALRHPILGFDVHKAEYYQSIRHFDQLSTGDMDDPASMLLMLQSRNEVDVIPALRTAAQQSVTEGVRSLGVPPTLVNAVANYEDPLLFWTLNRGVQSSELLAALRSDTVRQLAALCTATCLAEIISPLRAA